VPRPAWLMPGRIADDKRPADRERASFSGLVRPVDIAAWLGPLFNRNFWPAGGPCTVHTSNWSWASVDSFGLMVVQ